MTTTAADRRTTMSSRKKTANREALLEAWIAVMNLHDKEKYLSFFTEDAVLDDPSVGCRFEGETGLGKYFDDYFVGYKTKTRLVGVETRGRHIHVQVHFTGDFPGGSTGGIFDVTFKGDKISRVHADLTEEAP